MPIETEQLSSLLSLVADPAKSKERLEEIKKFDKKRDEAFAAIKTSNEKLRIIDEKSEQLTRQEEKLAKRLADITKRELAVTQAEKQLKEETAKRLAEWQDRELALARLESEASKNARQTAQDAAQSKRMRALWEKKHDLIKQAEALG